MLSRDIVIYNDSVGQRGTITTLVHRRRRYIFESAEPWNVQSSHVNGFRKCRHYITAKPTCQRRVAASSIIINKPNQSTALSSTNLSAGANSQHSLCRPYVFEVLLLAVQLIARAVNPSLARSIRIQCVRTC